MPSPTSVVPGPVAASPARVASEAGTGLVASVVGVAVFLVLLLVAVQVAFDLYGRSAVTAAALSAASAVAGSNAGASFSAQAKASADARAVLGRYGASATFAWRVSPQVVELTVSVRNPSVLPSFAATGLGLRQWQQSVVVRREMLRP
ncbi:MAG: hypothetical protein ACRDWV_08070 [Acidimicrobiales bacterium]